jgi:hypothetical protein
MRTLIKSGFTLAVAGLLAFSLSAGTANASKRDYNEPMDPALVKCKEACKTAKQKKDHGTYENCMMKCSKDHKKDAPLVTPKK